MNIQGDLQNNSKTVTVAQVGVGYWGPNLLRNLVANARVNLKAVVDLAPERRQYVRQHYPAVTTFSDIESVLDDKTIDAVVIATPAASHFYLAMQVLGAGKHVLVEKPMAQTAVEVSKIAEQAADQQKVAMVGHTFLYNPAVRYLKNLIDSGELGEVRYIFSQRLNLGRIRSDVDALWNLAPHDVSIIQYLLGDPEPLCVQRQGMSYIQDGIDDVVFLHIEYANRVMAHIHVSWLDPHKIRQMTVVGTRKMVIYDDVADSKIAIYDKGVEPKAVLGEKMDSDKTGVMTFNYRSGDILLPRLNNTEPLKAEIDHWLDCILSGITCLTGTRHAAKVVHILEGASHT